MPIRHVVQKGEDTVGIAAKYGLFWYTIWEHADNAALRETRKNPNVLLEGDILVIPDRTPKTVACGTDKVHRFRRKGVPAKIRFRLLAQGVPRAGDPYRLEVDGRQTTGTIGDDGVVEAFVPPMAVEATLWVGKPAEEVEYRLKLGHLEPVNTVQGLQARLKNLGFYAGPITSIMNEQTAEALKLFQAAQELPTDGQPGPDTWERLERAHGS